MLTLSVILSFLGNFSGLIACIALIAFTWLFQSEPKEKILVLTNKQISALNTRRIFNRRYGTRIYKNDTGRAIF